MAVQAWRDNARCVGMATEIFFPESLTEARFDKALSICASCPVKDQCLMLVIELDDVDDRWGVFGETTPKQRRHIRYELQRGLTVTQAKKKCANVKR